MFLPLAHVLARVTAARRRSTSAARWRSGAATPRGCWTTSRESRADALPVGPARVREDPHARAWPASRMPAASSGACSTGRSRSVRGRAPRERAGRVDPLLRAQHAVADRLVLSKVRALFGGRLELALTGAAPIAADVLEFFDACGVPRARGLRADRDAAPPATLNTPRALRLGTVGRPLPGTDVRDRRTDGEILLRGPHVFARLPPRRRGDRRGARGRLAAHRRPRRHRRRRLPAHHRPQEGPDHHLERQEHHAVEHRVGAARVALDLAGGRVRRPPPVPRRAADARPRRGAGAGARARRSPPTSHRWRPTSACWPCCGREVDAVNERFARIEQIKRFAVLDARPDAGRRRADADAEGQAALSWKRTTATTSPRCTSDAARQLGRRKPCGGSVAEESSTIAAVDEEADRHLPGVAEDADAHPDAARARRPDQDAADRAYRRR